MPKMKSHSGMSKRVRVTRKGKLLRGQANRGHLMESKPSTRARRLAGVVEVAKSDVNRIKRMIGL